MRIAVEAGMHGASERSALKVGLSLKENLPILPKDPSVALDVFVSNDLAVDEGKRYIDEDLESAFLPGVGILLTAEDDIAVSIKSRYRELPLDKRYHSIIALHNCNFRNGRRIEITPDNHGDVTVSRRTLAIAAKLGTRRVVLINSPFHRSVGLTGTLNLEIPQVSDKKNEERQVTIYRKKLLNLALTDVQALPEVDIHRFAFYAFARDITSEQARELDLDKVTVTRAFQQLPKDVVVRLGIKGSVPTYAVCWNYDNFGVRDENGPLYFGQIVTRSFFDSEVKKRPSKFLTD